MTAPGHPREIPPQFIPDPPSTRALVQGEPDGRNRIGMVVKRTYRIGGDGQCDVASNDLQDIVLEQEYLYEDLEPPLVAPVSHDNDTMAFRLETDIVVQGAAHAYGPGIQHTTAGITLGSLRREITVWGDRVVEWRNGHAAFTEPEPFESIPLRYDRAYGGVDRTALERYPLQEFDEMAAARPEWNLAANTPYHYPRNPCGTGYVIEPDAESVTGLVVPNLEFPFDPITPDRLAVGHPELWMLGPLPAGLDWQGSWWFPRNAYLGLSSVPDDYHGPIAEIQQGWAAPDLLEVPPVIHHLDGGIRLEYAQAASAGMSLEGIGPGDLCELHNLHPRYPQFRIELPREKPDVRLGLKPGRMTRLPRHLNAVVIRPEVDELVMVWCASTKHRPVTPEEAENLRQQVDWESV